MTFHNIRFPTRISYGASGGPERRTDIVTLTSGHEARNTPWSQSRRRYDAGVGLCSLDDMADVIAFFEARQGQLYGFRWKDWADHKSCAPSAVPGAGDVVIGTGDGTRQSFDLCKPYASGPGAYLRPITHPVAGSVRVSVAGTEVPIATVDDTRGEITLDQAPAMGAVVCAGFEFDVPVRFDTDRIVASVARFQAGDVPDVPVVEVRI